MFDLDVLHTVIDWGIVICYETAKHLAFEMSENLILVSKLHMIENL